MKLRFLKIKYIKFIVVLLPDLFAFLCALPWRACVSFTILRSEMISSCMQNYVLFLVSKLDTRDRKNHFIIVYNSARFSA